MVIKIPLSKTGKHAGKYEAIIDDCDSDLAELNWHCKVQSNTTYVLRNISKNRSRKQERMHRIILSRMIGRELLEEELPDHIDGNGLNNRRSNLRIATGSQNIMNSGIRRNNQSGAKGVSKHYKRWRATIRAHGKTRHIGYYDTPELAHAAYCEAAIRYFGAFANDGVSAIDVVKSKFDIQPYSEDAD